jgi:hypothetical protein
MTGDRRLTIAGMLWVVALVGIWFASIRAASVVWTTVTATMTLAALLTGVLGAVYARGSSRAFWLGFALFGWAYLTLVNWDWVGGPLGHDLTGGLSDWAERLLGAPPLVNPPTRTATGAAPPQVGSAAGAAYFEAAQQRRIKLGNFVQIGRMTMSLLFALVGGLIGRTLAERAGRGDGSPAA